MRKVIFIPLAVSFIFAATEDHFYRAGLIATTNFYQDQALTKGLLNGNYRPFANYSYKEKYSAMLRGNMSLKHYGEKPASVDKQTNLVGALEIATFEAKLGRHSLTAGRSFYQTEQGILFANFADGILYKGDFAFGQIKAMGLYSADYGKSLCAMNITGCGGDTNVFNIIPGQQPDATVTGSGQRIFATAEYQTRAFNPGPLNMQGLLYGIYSKDLIKESASVNTRYEYNPYYAGLGAQGYVVNSRLQYRVDGIYQGGNVYNIVSNGTSIQSSIMAAAALARVTYYLPVLTKFDPQAIGEFATGTGDSDATRMSSASQSNSAGDYNAFQAFGAYSGGLALKPRLGNLQIYRLGFMARPLKQFYWGRNLSLQIKGSLYRKNSATGGISDSTATESSADVGVAGDVAINYVVLGDIQFFYGFGLFKPGSAYTDNTFRQAHIVSLTLVF